MSTGIAFDEKLRRTIEIQAGLVRKSRCAIKREWVRQTRNYKHALIEGDAVKKRYLITANAWQSDGTIYDYRVWS